MKANQLCARILTICRLVILSALLFQCSVRAQVESTTHPATDSICNPKVVVSIVRNFIIVCLNRYEPGNDSCTNFVLRIQKPYCADIRFNWTFNRKWHFDSVVFFDPMAQHSPMHADLSIDDAGFLRNMSIVFGPPGDSAATLLNTRQNSEIPKMLPDTAPLPIEYFLQKTTYLCVDHAVYAVIVHRTFTYPPGYMRREPVYNYPEIGMFHYGRTVRMPSNASIAERGFVINYWHIQNPPLKYDEEPLHYIESRKPKTNGPKKKSFITIKPLR